MQNRITDVLQLRAITFISIFFENTIGPVPLLGVPKDRLKGIRYLATGAEVPVSTSWVHSDYPDIVFADLGLDPVLPDQTDTVLDVILTEE